MRTGSLQSNLDVLSSVIYDSGELTSAVTSIIVPGLNGNEDGEYEIIARMVNGYNGACSDGIRFNGDSDSNYGFQLLKGVSTIVSAIRNTSQGAMYFADHSALGDINMSHIIIQAKNGYIRTAISKTAYGIATTTVTGINRTGFSWNNTSDNIKSITIFNSEASGIGIGSRIIILRRNASATGIRTGALNVQGNIIGTWRRIYSNTLVSATDKITISGLDGDKDILYKIKIRIIHGNDTDQGFLIRPNDVSTAGNYGYQYLLGSSANVGSARNTAGTGFIAGAAIANGSIDMSDSLLYAKQGYVRTLLSDNVQNTSTTTVSTIVITGQSWNNTNTNITSLTINGTANSFGIGTFVELYKINL
jgi:hypothetical protein